MTRPCPGGPGPPSPRARGRDPPAAVSQTPTLPAGRASDPEGKVKESSIVAPSVPLTGKQYLYLLNQNIVYQEKHTLR